MERKWDQGSGVEEEIWERRVGSGGDGGGKRDLKVRDWDEREWIGARGEMM